MFPGEGSRRNGRFCSLKKRKQLHEAARRMKNLRAGDKYSPQRCQDYPYSPTETGPNATTNGLFNHAENLSENHNRDSEMSADNGNTPNDDECINVNERTGNKINWNDGRRIVELCTLSYYLDEKGCILCGEPLQLKNTMSSTRSGFGELLYIQCSKKECAGVSQVHTGKQHTRPIYDVNTKASLAMYDSGMGVEKSTRYFSEMNIPCLSASCFRDRENELSTTLAMAANSSMSRALDKEIEEINCVQDAASNHGLVIKYDMGWQKRGSGRAYDSKSGVGTALGNRTGQVIGCQVRTTDCRVCSLVAASKQQPKQHQCNSNWKGTSKAMEPDVAISIVKDIEHKHAVDVLIMDEDATTIARIRKELDHEIKKWSDISHVKKHVSNAMWKLNKKYSKQLTASVINYLVRCFTYAVHQNKHDTENLKKTLSCIVPHAFGQHDGCSESWCGYLRNCEQYHHTTLINDLDGDDLKTDLSLIFDKLVQNACNLAPCGSTVENESMNNLIASKAPKSRHYSSSNSLQNRVSCCVLQKNMGYDYVCDVNKSASLSPGKVTKVLADRLTSKRKYISDYKGRTSYKKRKLQCKIDLKKKFTSCEIREGVTYKTNINLSKDQDYENIPPPVQRHIETNNTENVEYKYVYFDLETSSLAKSCDILQISAICEDETFDKYIMPSGPISPKSSEVNGITFRDGKLYLNNTEVPAVQKNVAITDFMCWLENLGRHVLLIGHNAHRFDAPRLAKALKDCQTVNAFKNSVVGICDTLPLFKQLMPKLENHKQETIYSKIIGTKYNAHNALDDVKALQKIVQNASIEQSNLQDHSISCEYVFQSLQFDSNIASVKPLVERKIISQNIAKKIGSSGLDMKHLKLAYNRGGLSKILTEKDNMKCVRVTNRKKVIENMCSYFAEYAS